MTSFKTSVVLFAILVSLALVTLWQWSKVAKLIAVSHSPNDGVRLMAVRDMMESWRPVRFLYLRRLVSMANEDEDPGVVREALRAINYIDPSNKRLAELAAKHMDAKDSHLQSTACGLFAEMKEMPQEVSDKLMNSLSSDCDPVVRVASAHSLYVHGRIDRTEYRKIVLDSIALSERDKNDEAKGICERVLSGLE